MQDVLRGLPGVSSSNNGGPGKATSVFLRGTESDHVLVLIDGIKVGSATLGTTAFQDLPIEQIERIEVVRGPLSSLYGSEAIGGVIQIFTRQGGGPLKTEFSISGGSYGTFRSSGGLSGGGENGWFSINADSFDTNGFNACDGQSSVGGCFTSEPDNDSFSNRSISVRGGYHFRNGLEFDLTWLRAQGDNQFDGGFVNESDFVQQVVGGRLRFSPLKNWKVSLTLGQSRDESDNFKADTFKSRFDTERDTFSFQNDFAIGVSQLFTLGFDYQDDRVDSSADFAQTSRDNKAVFTQYQARLSSQDFQLSFRQDDNQQFGGHTTGSAAWGYRFSPGLRLTASYGTAFKAPTFNELFFPGFGNPKLDPETSHSLEVGLLGSSEQGRWSVNFYQTHIDDLIAFDASTFAPANVDSGRVRGIEAQVGSQVAEWDLEASFTLIDPENRSSGPNRGNVLPRRARKSLRLDADRAFRKFRLGATLFVEGSRFDDLANTRRLGGYSTVSLRSEYILSDSWRLQAHLENLFDKDYETAAFFNQPGRNLFVTLRFHY